MTPVLKNSPRKRVAALLILVVVLGFGAVLVRSWAVDSAVKAAVSALRTLAQALRRDTSPRFENESGQEVFPLWPLRPGQQVALEVEKRQPSPTDEQQVNDELKKAQKRKSRTVSTILPPLSQRPRPKNASASEDLVLTWAEKQLVPLGISRPASEGVPAGIELFGVGALGVGLVDGDRLVSIDGVSVERRGQVIGAVLAARAGTQDRMTAGLVRITKEGPVAFSVVVFQPYPEIEETDTMPPEGSDVDAGDLQGTQAP